MSLSKEFSDKNVLELARERMRTVFDRFEHVSVSFSGGKDSTVVLQLALEEAERRGRLPLEVVHFDEEAIHPPTIEYVERVSNDPRLNFHWYCLPVRHRNACSRKQPYWYCWNPKEKDIWVRPLPEKAITYLKGFKAGMDVPTACTLFYPEVKTSKIQLLGIRTEESLRRYRAVTNRVEDNWLSLRSGAGGFYRGYPIYDWSSLDVWLPISMFGWDYNRTYDILNMYGFTPLQQRVCPPYGEEPLRGLHLYKACFPKMWEKMLNRVPGAHAAAMYGNSDIYGVRLDEPPEGQTWREYLEIILTLWDDEKEKHLREHINTQVRLHYYKSTKQLHEDINDPVSGMSWKFLCRIALSGDLKNRIAGVATRESGKTCVKLGITPQQAIERWATEQFKNDYKNGTVRKPKAEEIDPEEVIGSDTDFEDAGQ